MIKFTIKICVLWSFVGTCLAQEITAINFSELPGDKAELRLKFDGNPTVPKGFTINKPARIVLDFAGVDNVLAQKKFAVEAGSVDSAVVVSGGGRTRVILNLESLSPYNTNIVGDELVVIVGEEAAEGTVEVATAATSALTRSLATSSKKTKSRGGKTIENIDFRRGEDGEGKVIVKLSTPSVAVDIEEVAKGFNVRFIGMSMPSNLRRKLDVIDFATPVTILSSGQQGADSVINIAAKGDYDYLAYQADNQYVLSVKPLTKREVEDKKKEFAYTGEKLSLNFQNIQVRSVLQVIADFTDLNLVASDTVTGSITLRLESVPWDQALDIVLKAKGLDKRLTGSVLMIAPAAEIAERERQEIETKKQLEELAPLRTEYLRIRYANAKELFQLFIDSSAGQGGGSGGAGDDRNSTGSILSERGQAIVDERTNSIILTDTEEKIQTFKELVERIDIPIQQVMIEARIVIANDDFRKELGTRISGLGADQNGDTRAELTGRLGESPEVNNGRVEIDVTPQTGVANFVNLGVSNPTGAFTASIIRPDFLLALELSALQTNGFSEVVSQPKVITGDKQQATIESGTEIPFLEESASGGATIAFKDAVLKLDVTPQITPDGRVIMDLIINQDSISQIVSNSGVPVIDVTQLETQVIVEDGGTAVLGGIYKTELFDGVDKVPLLGDIPFVGRLFRKHTRRENKREILIFVTPKIISSDYIQ